MRTAEKKVGKNQSDLYLLCVFQKGQLSSAAEGASPEEALDIPKNRKGDSHMTKSVRLMLMGAALTGFVAGQNAFAQDTTKSDDTAKSDSGKKATKSAKDKHACKGQNSCKGKGGCKSGDNGCKAKNSCKGKGGCRTDGKPMDPAS